MQARAALKLLLIEDSDTEFLLLERKMSKLLAPVHISRAANGPELAEALKQDYDLIISDFHIPDAEGDMLLALIAKSQGTTPCIVMSGSSFEFSSAQTPPSVIAKIEKGDVEALRDALQKASGIIGFTLNES